MRPRSSSLSACFVPSAATYVQTRPILHLASSACVSPHHSSFVLGARPRYFLVSTKRRPRQTPPFVSPLTTACAASSAVPSNPLVPDDNAVNNKGTHHRKDNPHHSGQQRGDPPSPDTLSSQVASSALTSLFAYCRQLCRREPFIISRLIAAIGCILISKLIGITVPFFFKRAIDLLMQQQPVAQSTSLGNPAIRSGFADVCIAMLLHGLVRILASFTHEMRNTTFARAGQRIGRSITTATFAHIHSLEAAFHTSSRTGALTRVVDRGTRSILTLCRAVIFSFFPSFFELALVCGVLFTRFSATYVLITLLTFFVFTWWTLSVNDRMSSIRGKMNAVENIASAKLTDSLINVEAVKAFDNAPYELSRYDDSLAEYEEVAIDNEWLYGRLNIGQTVVYTLGLTALLICAANDVTTGRLTVGSVVLLATMLQRLWIPLDFLGWQYREVKQSLIDMQNLFEVLKREPRVKEVPGASELSAQKGEVVFENVTFIYPEADESLPFTKKDPPLRVVEEEGDKLNIQRRRVALDGLSLSVPAGSSVALVGSSGSGKSTATRLLYRLYDLTGGAIYIDGQDISKVSLSSLRQAVSIVPQDTALFNETIAFNIRYGRPTATDEEVITAAKAASIHDVIMRTAKGYETMVGERGVKLSGGERQRLSVARAFLKQSQVIVEDESTSALDTLTEMEVTQSLVKLGINRTRIIVAHRLSTVMNVDRIIVMNQGRKVEEGTFQELVSKVDGIFKSMWERQQKRDDGDSNGITREDGVNEYAAASIAPGNRERITDEIYFSADYNEEEGKDLDPDYFLGGHHGE